jgi:hypothetical protein
MQLLHLQQHQLRHVPICVVVLLVVKPGVGKIKDRVVGSGQSTHKVVSTPLVASGSLVALMPMFKLQPPLHQPLHHPLLLARQLSPILDVGVYTQQLRVQQRQPKHVLTFVVVVVVAKHGAGKTKVPVVGLDRQLKDALTPLVDSGSLEGPMRTLPHRKLLKPVDIGHRIRNG